MKKCTLSVLSLALFTAWGSVSADETSSVYVYPEQARMGSTLTILSKNVSLSKNIVGISHHWLNENGDIVATGRKLKVGLDNLNHSKSVKGCATVTSYEGKSKLLCSQPVMFNEIVPLASLQPIIKEAKITNLAIISKKTEVSYIAYDPDVGTEDRDGLADKDIIVWTLEGASIGSESTVKIPETAVVGEQLVAHIQVTSDDTTGGASSTNDSVTTRVLNNYPGGNCDKPGDCSMLRPLYVDETILYSESDIQTFTTDDDGIEIARDGNDFSVIPLTPASKACAALGDYQLVSNPERLLEALNDTGNFPSVANWPDGRQYWTSKDVEGDVFGSVIAVSLDDNTGKFAAYPVNPTSGGLVVCEAITTNEGQTLAI